MPDITTLITNQRESREYKNTQERINNIYNIDTKVALIREMVSEDRKSGRIILNQYTEIVNKTGSANVLFFDEYFANICLSLFRNNQKTRSFRKDLVKVCKSMNNKLEKEFACG